MDFEIIGEITAIETIATGRGVHARRYLTPVHGRGHWRKMKGVAMVRTFNSPLRRAEVHWYEAHGIGKKEIKRKRYLD